MGKMTSDVNIFAGTAKEPVVTISRIELAAKSAFMYQLINSLNICDGCGETISIIFAEEKKETLMALMAEVTHFRKSGLSIIKDTNDVRELRRKIGLNQFEQLTKRDLEIGNKNKVEQDIADECEIRKNCDNNFNVHAATDENVVTAQILENKAKERNNDEKEVAENNEIIN